MTSISSTDKLPLAIEPTAHNQDSGEDGVVTIDVDGTPVKLDKLGPMIINSDGVSTSSSSCTYSCCKCIVLTPDDLAYHQLDADGRD
jgi:hypothetical protein